MILKLPFFVIKVDQIPSLTENHVNNVGNCSRNELKSN